jgi:hypothetical protein
VSLADREAVITQFLGEDRRVDDVAQPIGGASSSRR